MSTFNFFDSHEQVAARLDFLSDQLSNSSETFDKDRIKIELIDELENLHADRTTVCFEP